MTTSHNDVGSARMSRPAVRPDTMEIMSRNKIQNLVRPIVGPLRFTLAVRIGEDRAEEVVFIVHAMTVPRAGERLVFDPQDPDSPTLEAVVSEVTHNFFAPSEPDDHADYREFTVEAITTDEKVFEQLLDDAELHRWVTRFRMLES